MFLFICSKIKSRLLVAAQLFLVLAFAPMVSLATVPAGIAVTIVPTKAEFGPQEELMVKVSYTNVTTSNIRFLKWGTGLDGRFGPDVVDLKFGGVSLVYAGVVVKRSPPTESDFVTLSTNETLSAEVSLDSSYEINLQGQYLIEPRVLISQPSNLKFIPNTFSLSVDRPVYRLKRPAAFTECTAGQQNQIDSSLGAAESISRKALDDLNATPASLRATARRYKEWFGGYDANRWNKVKSNFTNIYNATANKTVGFDCSCDDSGIDANTTYAYVFANDPYNMNVCGAFWRAPLVGTDSKAGTIVHELSHFDIVAATDDIQYGQSAARSLASSNPAAAIKNADSHEYFAENTPFLNMPTSADLPPELEPDLVVSSSIISDANPSAGRPTVISGTIANQGDGASSSTSLSLTLLMNPGSPVIFTNAIPALAAGANFSFQFDFDAPDEAGEYTVTLCISAVSGESNTANNCSALAPLMVKKSSFIASILQLLLDE